jgi:molybdopterin molybdotransferase
MSEPDVSNLIGVTQAVAIIDAVRVTPRVTRVPVVDALGLRLAENLLADRDFPPFDKSQMDGYAVRSADVATAPAELAVVGEVAAGTSFERELQPGETVAIMTGAPMPAGADGVIPVEDSERVGDDRVRFAKPAVRGRYIAPRGSDAKEKQLVLPKGVRLDAAQLAVAASVGAAEVPVFERPRVAVLSTGDELVPVEQTPGPHQIRNSNSVMLLALLRKLGCQVTDVGSVRDDPELIRAAIEEGLKHDVLFVTGGMSMGTHDHVPQVLKDLGFDLKVTKLRVKPGKPFVFGVRGTAEEATAGRFVFGLPGNPVSGFVCTVRLASRLLARLAGGEPREKWLAGRLEVGMAPNGPREFYQPVIWSPAQGGTSARSEFANVTPLNWKGSADLFTLAKANAFLVRPENEPPLAKGTLVRVLEI